MLQVSNSSDYKKYLIPSVVARLSTIELKAKLIVKGFIAGLHKSPYHGFSVEFAEHRQYIPGDDLKYLDWKVYARTDRYYIKRFEEETNLKSYILLDISRSMDFSSEKLNSDKTNKSKNFFKKYFSKNISEQEKNFSNIKKLEYSSYLAASLSYLMLLQKDAISLTLYDTLIRNYIPPRSTSSNLKLILKELNSIIPNDKTGSAKCLNEVAGKIKKHGFVIIISDFFDDVDSILTALKHFKYNKNEVILFQILDPAEMVFLEGNPVTLVDIETKEEMYSQPFAIKKTYEAAIKEFLNKIKSECRKNNIDHVLISTETPFDKALLSYLQKRKRMK